MDTRLEIVLAARDVTGQAFSKVQNRVKRLSKAVFSLNGVMVGAAGLGYFVKKQLEAADAIAKTADVIGISTKSLQQYRFIADRAGVTTSQLEQGFGAFTKRLGELKIGTGALNTILSKNNEELKQQLIAAGSTDEALNIFINTLAGVETQSEKAALSAAAFSRTAGIQLTNIVKGGTASIAGMRREFKQLGLEIDEHLLRSAEETIDKFTNLEFVIRTRLMSTVLEFAPEISKISESMTDWVIANDKLIKQEIPGYLKDVLFVGRLLGATLSGVVNKFEQVIHLGQNIKGFFVEDSKSPHLYNIPSRPGDPGTPDSVNVSAKGSTIKPFMFIENEFKDFTSDMEKHFKDEGVKGALDSFFADLEDQGTQTADVLDNAFDGWANNFSQTLTDMIWESDLSFKSIARSYGKMLTEMLMQENVVKPSMGIFNKLIGSVDWGGALSGLFGSGSVAAGSYSAPTFSMAGGGMINEHVVGVGTSSGMSYEFGEAGSEVVLPSGAGGVKNIYNININAVDHQSFTQMIKNNPTGTISVVRSALTGNTELRQIMRGTI